MEVPYVNPDALLPAGLVLTIPSLELELDGDKRQHVLSSMEEGFSGLVIDGGLRGVEALEVILLRAIAATLVRLDEARITEEQ